MGRGLGPSRAIKVLSGKELCFLYLMRKLVLVEFFIKKPLWIVGLTSHLWTTLGPWTHVGTLRILSLGLQTTLSGCGTSRQGSSWTWSTPRVLSGQPPSATPATWCATPRTSRWGTPVRSTLWTRGILSKIPAHNDTIILQCFYIFSAEEPVFKVAIPTGGPKVTSMIWSGLDDLLLTGHDTGDLVQWDVKTQKKLKLTTGKSPWQ